MPIDNEIMPLSYCHGGYIQTTVLQHDHVMMFKLQYEDSVVT
jgi:hypothetical protein